MTFAMSSGRPPCCVCFCYFVLFMQIWGRRSDIRKFANSLIMR